jgi:hypothetical protein
MLLCIMLVLIPFVVYVSDNEAVCFVGDVAVY